MSFFETGRAGFGRFCFFSDLGFFVHRGELRIAEVTSRFTSIDAFVALITSLGFESTHKVRGTDLLRSRLFAAFR